MLLKSNTCLLLESNKKTPNSLSSFHVKLPSIFCSMQPMTGMGDPLRPRGFGEGKVYDTSLEDKLLQPQQGKLSKHKEPEVVQNGIRVRLVNLPKKKNIHRDLRAAFKPFPGIINIIPAVSGNEKTREPVCKGFAFVDFKSEKEANRFVDILSTQPITFGKVQKQIRCEIMKSSSSNQAPVKHRIESPLPVLNAPMAVNSKPFDANAVFDMLKIGELATNDNNFGKSYNVVQEPEAGSESLDKQKKVREKGARAKKKVDNSPKLSLPGSANRLKTKEKALLSGVFVKYAGRYNCRSRIYSLLKEEMNNTTPIHNNDADEDDENVKQLQQCSSIYILLQGCLVNSNRNWKACQKAWKLWYALVRAHTTFLSKVAKFSSFSGLIVCLVLSAGAGVWLESSNSNHIYETMHIGIKKGIDCV
ncbi:hypothetical protein R6Q57_022311 [Mikania cordata]